MKRQNEWKRERDVRRKIKKNFSKGDYWMTITYKKGSRPTWEEMKEDIQWLIRTVRRRYQKYGQELKYIYRLGIGKRGAPHIHILVNRFATKKTGTDMIFTECWTKGHINIRTLYDAGGYKELAGAYHKTNGRVGTGRNQEIPPFPESGNCGAKEKRNESKESCGQAGTGNIPKSS